MFLLMINTVFSSQYGPHQEDWSECFRSDGHNLVKEWKQNHGLHSKFVRNREELAAVEGNSTDFLLGLFSEGHMEFEDLRKAWRDPSLAEMTSKAIEVGDDLDDAVLL